MVERAWWTEKLHRIKRLPSKADDFFKKELEVLGPEQLFRRMKEVTAEVNAMNAKAAENRPKLRRA